VTLTQIRARYNCTKPELANRLGVTTQDVEHWEKSGRIPQEMINPICQQFKCHPARLLGLRDISRPKARNKKR
jgi:DNA-binding transcriptional regulator YiaG